MNVVTIITAPFTLRPGANEINKSAYSTGRFAFGNNNYGLTASQSGRFLEGDYEYCYEVDVSASKDPRLPWFSKIVLRISYNPVRPCC